MPELAAHILSSLRCGVVTADPAGNVTTVNPQAAAWLGIDPATAPGHPCREVFAGCPAVAHLLLDALERSTLPDRAELEVEVGGDRRLLMGFSLSRVVGNDGELLGSAIFFKDLTAVEEERGRQALRSRLASLGEVAAQLAHEIRNRLGGIRGFLGLARRRLAGDAEGLGYLDRCETELLAANAKMTEMLLFARPLALERRPVGLETLCREALEATLARFPGWAPRVHWEGAEGLPLVDVDAPRLRDALANLLANAVEVTGPGGNLWLRVRRDGDRICIEIEDDGPGMAPEVLRRIFHPFFTTKEGGSGLGVPTAQKILDAHGGSVDAESWPGRGTRFVVRLPGGIPEGGT